MFLLNETPKGVSFNKNKLKLKIEICLSNFPVPGYEITLSNYNEPIEKYYVTPKIAIFDSSSLQHPMVRFLSEIRYFNEFKYGEFNICSIINV